MAKEKNIWAKMAQFAIGRTSGMKCTSEVQISSFAYLAVR